MSVLTLLLTPSSTVAGDRVRTSAARPVSCMIAMLPQGPASQLVTECQTIENI